MWLAAAIGESERFIGVENVQHPLTKMVTGPAASQQPTCRSRLPLILNLGEDLGQPRAN